MANEREAPYEIREMKRFYAHCNKCDWDGDNEISWNAARESGEEHQRDKHSVKQEVPNERTR